ncbi:DUF1294 domain-containing protein [Phenylobacterium sp. LjRoot225]|uniref:DUF1294 domain-containing protein n=1 Tax=Phenylobacterium sp. LjRoot225 TaxID=3342285 RepID=UPI003ECF50A6
MFAAVAVYLVAINLAAFAAFGLDKRRALRGGWRIPERRLLSLAAIGGGAGAAAAQRLFRHKTVKEPFASLMRLILTIQAIAGGFAVWLLR